MSGHLRRQEAEGWTAERTIVTALRELAVPEEAWGAAIEATLLSLRGWAGMMRQFEHRPDRAPVEARAARLLDYLAVQLVLDVHAARHAMRNHPGGSAPDDTAVRPGLDLVYEAFVLAQVMPVDTAVRVLDAVRATAGDTLVVSGAAGGVGTVLIQLARAAGLIVVGTASAANLEYVEALGALATTYDDGWVDRVRELAVAEVDAAADLAGAGVLPQLIALTGDPSRVVTIADPRAAELGVTFTSGGGDKAAALQEASRLLDAGDLRVIVEQTFPIKQTPEAQRRSEGGHMRGRAVVEIAR